MRFARRSKNGLHNFVATAVRLQNAKQQDEIARSISASQNDHQVACHNTVFTP